MPSDSFDFQRTPLSSRAIEVGGHCGKICAVLVGRNRWERFEVGDETAQIGRAVKNLDQNAYACKSSIHSRTCKDKINTQKNLWFKSAEDITEFIREEIGIREGVGGNPLLVTHERVELLEGIRKRYIHQFFLQIGKFGIVNSASVYAIRVI